MQTLQLCNAESERSWNTRCLVRCLYQVPPPRAQRIIWKRLKACKSQWVWMMAREPCPPDRTGLMHTWRHKDCAGMHKACTDLSQMESQCWEGEAGTNRILNHKASSSRQPLAEEKLVSPRSLRDGQCKMNSRIFWGIFAASYFFVLAFSSLTGLLLIYYSFWFWGVRDFSMWMCLCIWSVAIWKCKNHKYSWKETWRISSK